MRRAAAVVPVVIACCALAASAGAKVLRVGSFHGVKGQFTSIQAAVKAAKPGDWILIGPGDYKTSHISHAQGRAAVPGRGADHHAQPAHPRHEPQHGDRRRDQAGLGRVQQQGLGSELRPAGSASSSASPYAVKAAGGASGVNGLMVWKAANVSIENLTACNFLGGSREAGNEIWWNGGAESGQVGGHGFTGQYLTATSTYLKNQSASGEVSAAQYGMFSSNWSGGTWNQVYASQLQRLGLLHRRLPAGVRPDGRPRVGRVQRAGLLGLELGRPDAHRELPVRQQRGRVRHQQPERRQPRAPERRLPRRRLTAGQARSLLLGVHPQQRPRQQQPQRPGCGLGGGRPGRHRDVDVRRAQRHRHGQHVRPQQRLGRHLRPVPGQRQAVRRRRVRRHPGPPELPVGRLRRCPDRQHLLPQRLLRSPHQRRLRPGQLPHRPGIGLLSRQPRCRRRRRPARQRRGDAGRDADVRHHHDPVGQQRQPVPWRGPVRLAGADRPRHPGQLPERAATRGSRRSSCTRCPRA